MDWPPVRLLFITYKRTQVALESIAALRDNLSYPNLHYHICDDGSQQTDDGTSRRHVEVLAEAIGGDVTWHEMDTPPGKFNMGGNTNRGIKLAQDKGVSTYFIVQDDTKLITPLDLCSLVDILDTYPQVGFIRMNYVSRGLAGLIIGYTSPKTKKQLAFLRLIRTWSTQNAWQTNSYLHAFQPALIHKRFFEAYGWYPEGKHPGLTEAGMCTQYLCHDEDKPQILSPVHAWPMGAVWQHSAVRAHNYAAITSNREAGHLDPWRLEGS